MNSADDGDMRLKVDNVHKKYDGVGAVLRGVSFTLAPGTGMAVVGPSGSGKSTLLNVIGSLETPDAGAVTLGRTRVDALRADAQADYRSRMVGFVFQDHHLLPQCTAMENVLLPTLAARDLASGAEARAKFLLERVGLGDRAGAYPASLSGGERQRVAIARALVNVPPLLLCDEPTGNLDGETGASVLSLFLEVSNERGASLIVVTHDADMAQCLDRRFELRSGKFTG